MQPYPRKQRIFARRLRRSQTDAEGKLWSKLRDRQVCHAKFRRQHPIGPFVTDFCYVESALAIELDGGQHGTQAQADQRRSAYLERSGYRVLRFWDNEVLMNIEAVLERIFQVLNDPHPCRALKRRGSREISLRHNDGMKRRIDQRWSWKKSEALIVDNTLSHWERLRVRE